MEFNFTEEHLALREAARRFAEESIRPVIADFDEKQEFPTAIFKQLADLQFLGIIFPEEYGGAGLDYISYAIVLEELARIDGSTALGVAAHNSLCSNHIYSFAAEDVRKKYVPKLASGEWLGTWALTEPHSGSDAGGLKTVAVEDGDSFVLNGTKCFATNGTVADVAVIMARTNKELKQRGVSAFVIEAGTPGFRPGKKENKLGVRSSDTSELILEDVRVPKSHLLGNLNEGFIQAMKVLDGGRISIAAMSVGLAQGALDECLKYVKQREAFGKTIEHFQAVQFFLADMATRIEASRLLTYKAGFLKDQGKPSTQASAMAKLYASETANFVTDKAVQIHGGYGMMKDYPVERHYRDVKVCEIGEGTSEIQRMVIARHLLSGQD
jgi:alkylation response protein AidB-like acyl-CoA dehydrogenase